MTMTLVEQVNYLRTFVRRAVEELEAEATLRPEDHNGHQLAQHRMLRSILDKTKSYCNCADPKWPTTDSICERCGRREAP